LTENIGALKIHLSEDEMKAINEIDQKGLGRKFIPADWPIGAYGWHQEPVFD